MSKKLWLISFCTLAISLGAEAQSSLETQPPSLASVKSAFKFKISAGAAGFANGIKIVDAVVTVDTTIRVSQKTAYLSVEISGISGINMAEILGKTVSGSPIKTENKLSQQSGF
jgi:hypothetical protein